MKIVAAIAVALAAGGAVTAAGYAVDGRDEAPPPEALGPGTITVVVDVEHSRFIPSYVRIAQGTRVRFVIANHDPINHEFIVGPTSVHDRHRNGTEKTHPPKPGEISLGPDDQGVTIYRFKQPGIVEMACHLPGHYDFGMRGEIEVVAAET